MRGGGKRPEEFLEPTPNQLPPTQSRPARLARRLAGCSSFFSTIYNIMLETKIESRRAVSRDSRVSRDSTAEIPSAPSVIVKVRPLTATEQKVSAERHAWEHDASQIWQTLPSPRTRIIPPHAPYRFDRVFGSGDSTRGLFNAQVGTLIFHVMAGFNAAILAYGQTSSGKTSLMRGLGRRGRDAGIGEGQRVGLIALTVDALLSAMRADADPSRWSLTMSIAEVYNETVNCMISGRSGLTLFDGKDGQLRIGGLEESEPLRSWDDAAELLARSDQYAHVGATRLNERSSRAHVVCRLRVSRSATPSEPTSAVSEIHLCDLAGSERVSPHARSAGTIAVRHVLCEP